MNKTQLTLNFDAGLAESYASCREVIAARTHKQGKLVKAIAADMDYAPSDWTRKCAESPDDSRRMTLNDLEKFVQVTGDVEPILYLVEKYLYKQEPDLLKKQIAELQQQLENQQAFS